MNAVCYHVHSVPWFWFKHVGNFGMIAVWLLPPWRQCTLCIQSSSLYATKWSMLLTCMQLTLVTWYVASILCCHYWMQSYPSIVWFLCVAVRICARDNLHVFPTDLLFCMKSVVYVSWLTLWTCWLHSCRMFVLTVEYGLVHRGHCMNCETLYFSFDPAFVWPDLGRADLHSA